MVVEKHLVLLNLVVAVDTPEELVEPVAIHKKAVMVQPQVAAQ